SAGYSAKPEARRLGVRFDVSSVRAPESIGRHIETMILRISLFLPSSGLLIPVSDCALSSSHTRALGLHGAANPLAQRRLAPFLPRYDTGGVLRGSAKP
ncbi:MAG: hypothetical protein QE284_15415, partial [Rhizobium sp.]|nr:hypothetical protein [Rhizobium sp.]